MAKFKVGDRVIASTNDSFNGKMGCIVQVKPQVISICIYGVKIENSKYPEDAFTFSERELEPVYTIEGFEV